MAKSKVNAAGNYTKPTMRKNLVAKVKAGGKGGKPGQWSARKAQMVVSNTKLRVGATSRESSSEVTQEVG